MKTMTKMALISASVLSMGALSACQSTNAPKDNERSRMMKEHHSEQTRKLTPEQREEFKAKRAEQRQFFADMKKACDGKASGTAVQLKAGEKTVDGTCTMTFKADRKAMKQNMHKARAEHKQMRGEHRPMRGEMKGPMHMQKEPLTDAKRAELVKQFDQRLAERQALQQAIAKACQGKADGTAVQIKAGERSIDGKCQVRFKPTTPVKA